MGMTRYAKLQNLIDLRFRKSTATADSDEND